MSVIRSESDVTSQVEADRLYADLQHEVGERARQARSLDDVDVIAAQVRLLRNHVPRTVDILASAEADGSGYVEHGFATEDGFVGTENARVICTHHEALTPWPCPDLRELVQPAQLDVVLQKQPAPHLPEVTPADVP